jgi:hypothetical protein
MVRVVVGSSSPHVRAFGSGAASPGCGSGAGPTEGSIVAPLMTWIES